MPRIYILGKYLTIQIVDFITVYAHFSLVFIWPWFIKAFLEGTNNFYLEDWNKNWFMNIPSTTFFITSPANFFKGKQNPKHTHKLLHNRIFDMQSKRICFRKELHKEKPDFLLNANLCICKQLWYILHEYIKCDY